MGQHPTIVNLNIWIIGFTLQTCKVEYPNIHIDTRRGLSETECLDLQVWSVKPIIQIFRLTIVEDCPIVETTDDQL